MKAHIGVDAEKGLVYTVIGTAANIADVTQAAALLHRQETDAWGDAGFQGVDKHQECKGNAVRWEVAMRPGNRRRLDLTCEIDRLLEKTEKLKASIRAKVKHPFRVVKQQFGYSKVRSGKEHSAADDAVRAWQAVYGAQAAAVDAGITTSWGGPKGLATK